MLNLSILNLSYSLHTHINQNFFFSKNASSIHGYPRISQHTSQIFLVNRTKSRELFRSLFLLGFIYMALLQLPLNIKTLLIRWKNWRKKPHNLAYVYFKGKPKTFGRFMFLNNFFLLPFFLRDGFLPNFFGFGFLNFTIIHPIIYHPFVISFLTQYLKNRLWFRYSITIKYRLELLKNNDAWVLGDHARWHNLPLKRTKVQYVIDWERYLLYHTPSNDS
jgi:hypothetical protein